MSKRSEPALVVPTDVADPDAVDAAADRCRAEPRSDRRVGQRRVHDRCSPRSPRSTRRVPTADRGDLPRIRVGHAAALARMRHAPARHDRPGRFRARVPGNPAAVRLLRRQARHPRIHRSRPLRAAPRAQPVRITMVQMPAVNTPQFSWVLSRLPRHPQPVPPIYQPEVAARARVQLPTIRTGGSTGSARAPPPRCSPTA